MAESTRDTSLLLVEDNRDDEWIALRSLKKMGILNITVARDGCEALLLLHGDAQSGSTASCSPDIILLDLRLPKIDGVEVLRRIRVDDRTRNIPVVILTSSEDPRDQNICRELHVTAFLPKPLKVDAMNSLNLPGQSGRHSD